MFVSAISAALRLAGFVLTVWGLWKSVGGMRVVVSGRIDERNRAANSLKSGLPLLIIGLILLFFGSWLTAEG
jgi:hypothetical protein